MGVAGMLRNRWPECFGMPGRNRPATSGRIGAENAPGGACGCKPLYRQY